MRNPFPIIWNYLKPSWEGEDGKPSYRRMSQLVFIALIIFIVVKGQTQSQYGFYSLIVLCLTFLLLAAIISADQIISCIKGIKGFLPGGDQPT
jgi:hypothetical protein